MPDSPHSTTERALSIVMDERGITIVGTEEGLGGLRHAIDRAVREGEFHSARAEDDSEMHVLRAKRWRIDHELNVIVHEY